MPTTYVAASSINHVCETVAGSFESIAGERFYRVANYDAMPPFFMSLVSNADHWLFISSNGALTAGRVDPDHALFPYYTDDRIHDSQGQTGGLTVLRVKVNGRTYLWEPFSRCYEGLYRLTRNLYKSVYGNRILFEEINQDLSLVFRSEWMNSERFGFVRRSTLLNEGEETVSVDLVDGIQNVLPACLDRRFQTEYSTLADGYKRTEIQPESQLALFRLSSVPVDKAEPSEALRVNVAWSVGLGRANRLLSSGQLGAFRRGRPILAETDVRGQRGAYFLNAVLEIPARSEKDWLIVADVDKDASGVVALKGFLASSADQEAAVLEDVERGTRNLVRIVAAADGLQLTGDEASSWRHFSNSLFNVMRGGIPAGDYLIDRDDLRSYLAKSNRDLATRLGPFLDALPEPLTREGLMERVREQEDADLERLACEYLPLTFSRRHGDPSRPWNIFSIRLKDPKGRRILNYEGNWRDIFQNWEALGHSYPGFLEGMIAKFVNCSTADGHNPYRVMREGFEWETIDPHDAWSFIGYWGDHQVVYLLKLLEACDRHQPGILPDLLDRRIFAFAQVPYAIKPYEALLADPRNTIVFDQAIHRRVTDRADRMGTDGKLLNGQGGIARASLLEKLLLVPLCKLSNFIPEAGIWMNTQRPEWNDANNALVGFGVSVVTLCYLRRYLAFCRNLLRAWHAGAVGISAEIAELLDRMTAALAGHAACLESGFSDVDRRRVLDALGKAGSDYREKIYGDGFKGPLVSVRMEQIQEFIDIALRHIDHAIAANRRSDGLYHSYNLMKVAGDGIEIRNLYEMLEGQVAALSSGRLSAGECADLLDALRQSRLYRPDQASYVLYPDRSLPHFLDKNNVPSEMLGRPGLLETLLQAQDGRIVDRDIEGTVHFNPDFRNATDLKAALETLKEGPYRELVEQEERSVLELYERVFDHQSFTGRSGTFYKYEGLGCIYWHMVSKLLLAVDEVMRKAAASEGEAHHLARLRSHYHEIREGIGVHKSPERYGAIPTDPYSHTPGFAGAQQPGMTGQVKEDFLTRFSELGVQVRGGRISFHPWLVDPAEFLEQPATFSVIDGEGQERALPLAPGTLAFTLCQVPVVLHRVGGPRLRITGPDGSTREVEGLELDASRSAAIFERRNAIQRLDVFLGQED